MNLQLEAMALDMPDVGGHPNRLPFRGVLTLVGVASPRTPGGAKGHRVMLTRGATDAALPSLLGMALDYAPRLDSHDARRKIGIITEANIEALHPTLSPKAGEKGGAVAPPIPPPTTRPAPLLEATLGAKPAYRNPTGRLVISGYLFAHDFPDVVEEIRAQSSGPISTLGMSYEITQVEVPNLTSEIWTVTAFTFTGAAVLRRDRAAYPQTWITVEGPEGEDGRKAEGYG